MSFRSVYSTQVNVPQNTSTQVSIPLTPAFAEKGGNGYPLGIVFERRLRITNNNTTAAAVYVAVGNSSVVASANNSPVNINNPIELQINDQVTTVALFQSAVAGNVPVNVEIITGRDES